MFLGTFLKFETKENASVLTETCVVISSLQEVESLADELERKLELAPQKMLTQEEDLSRKKKRYKSLLQIKPAK